MFENNRQTHHALLAFVWAIPIALLGGLMGLGGAEFRLPVLAGILTYSARQAVPLNLAVSLITIFVSLLIRGKTLSLNALLPFKLIVICLIVSAVISAFYGATWARRISNEQLERIIFSFLIFIGFALIIEGFLPQSLPALVPALLYLRIMVSLLLGLAIGIVSSMLGVAGGELIIPTLVFAFGVDIKTAGTGSLLISLPTVLVGILRYAHEGAFANKLPLKITVLPMGIGSVIGAIAGGLLAGIVSPVVLKVTLGTILIISAIRVFYHAKGK